MKWVSLGLKLLPYIISAVEMVERFVTSSKGKPKEDAAVTMVQAILAAVEGGVGKDLLDDGEVDAATRHVIRAVVALQNLIASKRAAADAAA